MFCRESGVGSWQLFGGVLWAADGCGRGGLPDVGLRVGQEREAFRHHVPRPFMVFYFPWFFRRPQSRQSTKVYGK